KNDSTFRTRFAGFAIIPDPTFGSPNALAYFNLADNENTHVTFYYRAIRAGLPVNLATVFDFRTFANANLIRRDPSGSEYDNVIDNGIANDEKIYLQTSPGSFASLKIPGLATLSNRVIHRAQLVVEKVPSAGEGLFPPPEILFLDAIDSANNRFLTIPNDFSYDLQQQFYNIAEVGGIFHNNSYNFNISRYVQGIVTRKEKSYTLRLYAPYKTNSSQLFSGGVLTPFLPSELTGLKVNTPIAKGRVVVAGGAYPVVSQRLRLRIIYSKI
ncbi:MAG TPA: DUF4270 family protein, partial [Flavitalea sp.]|nr:DUF4270 family protein [Flavitalea sp.]